MRCQSFSSHSREACRSIDQILMRFMAKAWHLDLDEVVCEFALDHDHKFWFVRVVSFEWRDGQFVDDCRHSLGT